MDGDPAPGSEDRSRLRALWHWLSELPSVWAVVLVLVVGGGAALGGKYLYDTYYYVQHENDFCLSCHLMREPFERFARSAHQGLSCKACHRPTLVQRGRMGLAQILEQPEQIRAHAEVPNETCAECHIEGDPEKWRIIRNTAGHKVHLESDDPALQGLQCVECHSTSLHQFAPTRQTCAQSGCHDDVEVRLAGMGELTIHCRACHAFVEPTDTKEMARAEADPAGRPAGVLTPEREECLSCHTMRTILTDFPADDPHEARCGACHNPHEQETPRQAVSSCLKSGCHARLDTAENFHHQLEPQIVEDCASCHSAHDFRVEAENCRSCHQEIFRRRPGRTSSLAPPAPAEVAEPLSVPALHRDGRPRASRRGREP